MNLKSFAAAFMLVLASVSAAHAHTAVTKTSIAENSKLAQAPPTFTASFEHEVGVSSLKLVDASGKTIPLDFAPPKKMAKSFAAPLPQLPAGAYTLSWKTLSKDGHAMNGAVHFTITGG